MKTLILSVMLVLAATATAHASTVTNDDPQLEAIESQIDALDSSRVAYVCRASLAGYQFAAYGYLPRRTQIRALRKCTAYTGYRCYALGCDPIETAR